MKYPIDPETGVRFIRDWGPSCANGYIPPRSPRQAAKQAKPKDVGRFDYSKQRELLDEEIQDGDK